VEPDTYQPTRRLDARVRLLAEATDPLRNSQPVKVFLGTSQAIGRVRLIGVEALAPGEDGWMQLELDRVLVAARGDRFLLRQPSPGETLGGGEVADPHPERRYRRKDVARLDRLQAQLAEDPAGVLRETARRLGIAAWDEIAEATGLPRPAADSGISDLIRRGELVGLPASPSGTSSDALLGLSHSVEEAGNDALEELARYHAAYPLREGMPLSELRNRVGLEAKPFQGLADWLAEAGQVRVVGPRISLASHRPRVTSEDKALLDRWLESMRADETSPPSWIEAQKSLGAELAGYILENGLAVQVAEDVVWEKATYERLVERVLQSAEQQGSVTVAQVRDLLNSSRKYVLALLEHLDRVGATRREGDFRVVVRPPGGERS
jgi:selenocysteine-specific elongation factor